MSRFITLFANASDAINQGALGACGTSCNTATTVNSLFTNVTTVLIFLVGSISVVMVIIGGLRYVLSNGDSKQAAAAKDTILYAVVGVVVSIAAYAIIKFVATSIK